MISSFKLFTLISQLMSGQITGFNYNHMDKPKECPECWRRVEIRECYVDLPKDYNQFTFRAPHPDTGIINRHTFKIALHVEDGGGFDTTRFDKRMLKALSFGDRSKICKEFVFRPMNSDDGYKLPIIETIRVRK